MAAGRDDKLLSVRGRFWLGHLERWRPSGLSQAEYCRQHGLSAAAFSWWKGQLSSAGRPIPSRTAKATRTDRAGAFFELALSDAGQAGAVGPAVYEIALANRRCLRLGGDFEPERVRQLLAVMESGC